MVPVGPRDFVDSDGPLQYGGRRSGEPTSMC
jgi:hypothetical protein